MLDVRVDVEPARAGERAHGPVSVRAGGSPVTAALAARASGASALVVGRVGDDAAGRLLAAELAAAGVGTLLARDSAASTGVCVYAGGGVTASRGANARLAEGDLPNRLDAGAVLLSGHVLLRGDTEAAGRAALARSEASWVAVDAGAAPLAAARGLDAPGANAVLADEDEAGALTGAEADHAARALGARFELAVVKLGERGAVAAHRGRIVRAAAPPVERRDPAGAGDAFAGALLAALVGGRTLEDSLAAACAAGAAAASG